MNTPVRLEKVENKNSTDKLMNKIEELILNYAPILIPLGIVGATILFVIVLASMCGVSAVESGGLRNFLATGV